MVSTDVAAVARTYAAHLGDTRNPAGTSEQLTELIAATQALINAASAVQDAAIARLAATETQWAEDGTLCEVVRPLGHVALDAADIAAPALGVSHAQAQRRVEQAVLVAAGRVPVPEGCRELPAPSGLGGLHTAMRQGRLDGYRAGVLAYELTDAPADVARAVVAALDPHVDTEPAPVLRRRCRRLLARISPDLLRQRAERARRETGLRRWVTEPGVDTWFGTFPSEDAAAAWAAIDELARLHVADGTCTTVEQARGKALTDLVTGNATISVALTLTVPADDAGRPRSDDVVVPRMTGRGDDLVEVRGLRPSETSLVTREWLAALVAMSTAGTTVSRPTARRGPHGSREGAVISPTNGPFTVELSTEACHRDTGALVDPRVAGGYRPPERLARLVKARDGRCRFPGCSVSARFCDLDHVRPWPLGPTAADNLACLCRRHHRIKQSPGWRVRMLDGAVLEWTDPTGRVRTTQPVDALHGAVLPPLTRPDTRPDGAAATRSSEPLFSRVEFALEHLVAHVGSPQRSRSNGRLPRVDRCGTAELGGLLVDPDGPHGRRCGPVVVRDGRLTRRPHGPGRWPDEPPF